MISIGPPALPKMTGVLPKTKNPYFLENYFAIFRNPPTPNALKWMKSRIFFTIFGKLLKFRWIFIKTNTKNVEFDMKCWFFRKNQQNFIRNFAIKIEFRPVRRNVHFVDLEKCCKMIPWSQKSASIQKRTSPPKFLENRGSRMGVPGVI